MQPWFPEAKLGIFIHYGIYAVDGIAESWSFFGGEVSYEDYMKQLYGFTASKYDPEAWADLFVKAGAKYAVLTAKHHDGVALWDTDTNDLSVVKKTPAGRDLLGPYVEALRKRGIKVGIYYSHLDWSHPDYASVYPTRDSVEQPGSSRYSNRFAYPAPGREDPEAWKRFLAFHRAQLKEINDRYGPIDLWWFDGEWERDAEQFDMAGLRDELLAANPNMIANSRLLEHGDYATPEQGVPIVPPEGPWEFCVTVNDSWGYQGRDTNHKSVRQIVRMFAETIGMGGNMLLDIGPYEDGSLQPEQVKRLEGLGDWIEKNKAAVYGTERGLPAGLFYGASTLSEDRKKLYLFFFDQPVDQLAVKGLLTNVKSARVLASGRELSHKKIGGLGETPGVVWIDWPSDEAIDPNATVVQLEFEAPLEIYVGTGRG
ncbi:alpha-L-fucosidase [bacterium]|nr:MAG: alpha-L-fucosidase [bacterium]